MKRLVLIAAVSVIAFAGCKKKEEKKEDPSAKIRHGEQDGKGTGGGDKKAVGTKDAKPGSGKKDDGPAKADPAVLARGQYIAEVSGCANCHTPLTKDAMPDMTKLFGGGMEITEKMPDGKEFKWRSLNITNHDTGIGKWTDAQVIAAIREGKSADGSALNFMMPSMLYNVMTDDDAKALVAFLRSLPPVDNKVERLPSPFPPDMMPPIPTPANKPIPDDPVGKGAYYTSLMHCVMCHTPMGEKGPDMEKAFAGGFKMEIPPEFAAFGTGTLYSSNITPDPDTGIGKWTDEQIVAAFKTAMRPDGKPIMGPMMGYVQAGWGKMDQNDALAVAAYLKSLKPIPNKVPASTFKPGPALEAMMKGGGGGPPGEPPKPDDKGGGGEPPPEPKPDDKGGGEAPK